MTSTHSFIFHYFILPSPLPSKLWLWWHLVNSIVKTQSQVFWYKTDAALHCAVDMFSSCDECYKFIIYVSFFYSSQHTKSGSGNNLSAYQQWIKKMCIYTMEYFTTVKNALQVLHVLPFEIWRTWRVLC